VGQRVLPRRVEGRVGGAERGGAVGGGGRALQGLHLGLEKLDVVDGLVQHGGRVHLGAARDEALQGADALADALPPQPRRHALRVLGDAHVAPLRGTHRLRVDLHRLQRRDVEDRLPHRVRRRRRRRPHRLLQRGCRGAAVVVGAARGRRQHVAVLEVLEAAGSGLVHGGRRRCVLLCSVPGGDRGRRRRRRHVWRRREAVVTCMGLHRGYRRRDRCHRRRLMAVERSELLQLEHRVHQLKLRFWAVIQQVKLHHSSYGADRAGS